VNSGGTSAGGLTGAGRTIERDEPRERAGEAAAALWLSLSQRAESVQRLPLELQANSQNETPSAWRGSAGDLTPAKAAAPSQDVKVADSPAAERLTLRVDGGELGEVEVTLDRKDGALNVVIGLEKGHLVSSVLPDARALRQALEGAGLNVHNLSVVPTSEVGTVLAQRRLSPSGQKPAANPNGSETHPESTQRHTRKRLTLIG
jgi:flagellar hook-length control protein FliK